MSDAGDIDGLLAIMARLRDPAGGCPWDVQQTFATIAPYTIEEAYEVADAIVAKVCCTSHGHPPPGSRSRAMIASSASMPPAALMPASRARAATDRRGR